MASGAVQQHDPQDCQCWVVVDGSAAKTNWGVGAAIVGPTLARVFGDGLARYNWHGGGLQCDFFAGLRKTTTETGDTDATAEVLALLAGIMLNAEFCQERSLQKALVIIGDRGSVIENLAGCGKPGPVLAAAIERVAIELLPLALHYGPVVFLNKNRISAMDGTHGWLPHGLAKVGRQTGNMSMFALHPRLVLGWREWFDFDLVGKGENVISLTVTARPCHIPDGCKPCSKLPRARN
jgi:hypothetical protein